MENFAKYYDVNKKKWDELAELHYKKGAYDVKSFIKNRSGLYSIEIEEVGDVTNKSLLHLQCHFGKDTLSWALRGANSVVGVDFSNKAIEFAKELSLKMDLASEFILCNIYDLDKHLDEQFDIVFSSYGAIYWLHDLKKWAKLIARYLRPGGFFYIVDAHPLAMIFENDQNSSIELKNSYYNTIDPIRFEADSTYADSDEKLQNTTEYGWNHSLSEILNSLINAGLEINFLNEHSKVNWRMYDMLKKENSWWVFSEEWKEKEFPLLFSLKANKK